MMQKHFRNLTPLRDDIKISRKFSIFTFVKIDGGGGKVVYLYKRISLFPFKKRISAVKIDGGGGQGIYLYNVKIQACPNFLVYP